MTRQKLSPKDLHWANVGSFVAATGPYGYFAYSNNTRLRSWKLDVVREKKRP